MTVTRKSFPNPDRPAYWPGEEAHYRNPELSIGTVARKSGRVTGAVVAFDNTHSGLKGGRLVHLDVPNGAFPTTVAWEEDLVIIG